MTQLGGLVDSGNTVIVVEHEMRVVAGGDWVIDIGPGAGDEGGRVVAQGIPRRRREGPEKPDRPPTLPGPWADRPELIDRGSASATLGVFRAIRSSRRMAAWRTTRAGRSRSRSSRKIRPRAWATPRSARLALDKRFLGGLEATSRGEMLAFRSEVAGSAGYVAIERVVGTLQGLEGSFILQHSGTMDRGVPRLTVSRRA